MLHRTGAAPRHLAERLRDEREDETAQLAGGDCCAGERAEELPGTTPAAWMGGFACKVPGRRRFSDPRVGEAE